MDKPIITMCGSGVTACVLYLALKVLNGEKDVKVYDGSWAEYAVQKEVPIKSFEQYLIHFL